MQAQGRDLEEAATSLGASGWRTPPSRCRTSAGRCSTVSRCATPAMGSSARSPSCRAIFVARPTLPLHVELLYHDYNAVGAFAAASILTVLALVTIVAKVLLERMGAGRASRRPSLAANPSGETKA